MLQMICNSKNPQKMVEQIISQNPSIKNNPLIQNCLNLMSSGNSNNVRDIAKNVMKESGYDPDTVINILNNLKR